MSDENYVPSEPASQSLGSASTDSAQSQGRAASAVTIAREIFPDEDADFIDHAIWERTGFPSFFDLKKYGTIENALRTQLVEYRDALAGLAPGEHLCDFCNRTARSRWLCEEHLAALSTHPSGQPQVKSADPMRGEAPKEGN